MVAGAERRQVRLLRLRPDCRRNHRWRRVHRLAGLGERELPVPARQRAPELARETVRRALACTLRRAQALRKIRFDVTYVRLGEQ